MAFVRLQFIVKACPEQTVSGADAVIFAYSSLIYGLLAATDHSLFVNETLLYSSFSVTMRNITPLFG